MRSTKTLASVAIATFAAVGLAFAGNEDLPKLLKQKKPHTLPLESVAAQTSGEVMPLRKASANAKASSTTASILISEDFNKVTNGTTEKPDTTIMLASEWAGYSLHGMYIDSSLTNDGTWWGHQVYAAGGAVAIKTYNPQQTAYLCTPLGDYSGDITVTLRAKAIPDVITTDTGFAYGTGSGLSIKACKAGMSGQEDAKTDDDGWCYSERLYESQGWQKITYTFKNYSADKDGFIKFYTEGVVVLDDIEVTTASSFIAVPKDNGITDFQKDQFTISWDPVRKSFNYYVDLYTRNYLSENDTTYTADFEDGTIPAGFHSTSSAVVDTAGVDNSKSLLLYDNDTIVTPTNGNDYRTLHFYMRVYDDYAIQEYGEYAKWAIAGEISVQYKSADGWQSIGYFDPANFFSKPRTVELETQVSDFGALHATQFRIVPTGLDPGAYVVIDNIEATALPTFEYQMAGNMYGRNDLSDNYCVYGITYDTNYTFTDLDSLTEYWYGVRSHYVHQFAERSYIHALGVATPEALPATDIEKSGSFTANWTAVPKATTYTATCYGFTLVPEDNDTYPILEESFDKVNSDYTEVTDPSEAESVGNTSSTALDDFTALPGWIGQNNTLVQGMLGATGNYYSVNSIIGTPVLDLTHDTSAQLTLKLYGDGGDQIIVYVDGIRYGVTIPEDGVLDGTYVLPVKGERTRIQFWSSGAAPFVMDYVKVTQSVKKGEDILTQFAAKTTTGNASTSCTFYDLNNYPFDLYAYDVVAHFKYSDSEIATSLKSSNLVLVNVNDPTKVTINQNNAEVKETGRYTIDGRQISAPVKGINIVKMSDGTTRKEIVK